MPKRATTRWQVAAQHGKACNEEQPGGHPDAHFPMAQFRGADRGQCDGARGRKGTQGADRAYRRLPDIGLRGRHDVRDASSWLIRLSRVSAVGDLLTPVIEHVAQRSLKRDLSTPADGAMNFRGVADQQRDIGRSQ